VSDQQPWWHETPDQPPVDSVLEEGMKLFAALKDWAVESGAVAAVADLTASAASSAGEYLAHVQEAAVEPAEAEAEPGARCKDCPVCAGLDALEATNPEWAQTARSALAQVNAMIGGFLKR
jgi:hypothetical protein